ncbi:MAG: YceI family protein [Sediminibacterium sp.]|nr:YceI family protein [Sediminibacterium sp.]
MKFFFSCIIAMLFVVNAADAQKIFATRNGQINFSSPSDQDVKAVNNEVTSRLADNGQITFSLLIKGFKFKLAEMQEHFNDQYLESTKFPRADFKGNIVNLADVNFSKDGSYKVSVKGDLTLHGVTKSITANGTIEIKAGKPSASCQFVIVMKDFSVNASSVTEKVNVDISCQYQ